MDRAFQEVLKVEPLPTDPSEPPPKRQRTSADFFSFCNFILEYENYEAIKQQELRHKSSSPLGSTAESFMSDSNCSSSGQDAKTTDESEDDDKPDSDSWDLITCYCMKPFAGRPMIECSRCLTWVHLSCAKIRRNNIPEEFTCQMCKDSKNPSRRSRRVRESGSLTDQV